MNQPDVKLAKISRRKLLNLASYRFSMEITEGLVRQNCVYYYCPRCKTPLDREYTAFCDRCGQKLNWRGHKKARLFFSDPNG